MMVFAAVMHWHSTVEAAVDDADADIDGIVVAVVVVAAATAFAFASAVGAVVAAADFKASVSDRTKEWSWELGR